MQQDEMDAIVRAAMTPQSAEVSARVAGAKDLPARAPECSAARALASVLTDWTDGEYTAYAADAQRFFADLAADGFELVPTRIAKLGRDVAEMLEGAEERRAQPAKVDDVAAFWSCQAELRQRLNYCLKCSTAGTCSCGPDDAQ